MHDRHSTGFGGEVQAYVDGELDDAERVAFERRVRADPALAEEVSQLTDLKHALREAYDVAPAPRPSRERPARPRLAVAGALAAGIVLGVVAASFLRSSGVPHGLAEHGDSTVMTRVLLHVGSNDPDVMREALVSARYILADFDDVGRRVRVHVVANGKGLDMFRRRVTSFADEIRELERTYSNIQFVTCQNTIDRFEREYERPVELLPEVLRVDSIVADIARKRVQGWFYIDV